MRSSSDNASVVKHVALALIAGSALFGVTDLYSQSASAEPLHGGAERYLIAQGDASLPPPDPNYRPKNRFGLDSSIGAQSSGAANNSDQPLRRRLRRRLQQEGFGNGSGSDAQAGSAPGAGSGLGAGTGLGTGGGFGAGNGLGAAAGLGAATGLGTEGGAAGASGRLRGGVRQGGAFGAGRFANGAFAGGAFGGGANILGKRPLDLTSLNLSPDQKQKIQEMRRQIAPKTRDMRKLLNAKRMELRDMMFEATTGDDQVRSKRKEVRQLQDKIEELQINDFLSIRSILTPDQRTKLSDLKPGNKFAAGNNQPQLIAPAVSSPTP